MCVRGCFMQGSGVAGGALYISHIPARSCTSPPYAMPNVVARARILLDRIKKNKNKQTNFT